MSKKIFFLGCGKMGSVIANNIRDASAENEVLAFDINAQEGQENYINSLDKIPANYQADIIFIAIKPQSAKEAVTDFLKAKIFHKDTIFISILAGKTVQFLTEILGENRRIVRSMPNLPISVGNGIFPYFCNSNLDAADKSTLQQIFKDFGYSFEIENEDLLNILTAICGSGPAYIFLLQHLISKIAVENEIAKEDADNLVKMLFLGSSKMSNESNLTFKELKESVTSKAGTTEAALKVLQGGGLEEILKEAIAAAVKRSKDLN